MVKFPKHIAQSINLIFSGALNCMCAAYAYIVIELCAYQIIICLRIYQPKRFQLAENKKKENIFEYWPSERSACEANENNTHALTAVNDHLTSTV